MSGSLDGSHSRREQLFVCVLSFCTFRYLALSGGECHHWDYVAERGICGVLFLTSKVTCELNRCLSLEWEIRHRFFLHIDDVTV